MALPPEPGACRSLGRTHMDVGLKTVLFPRLSESWILMGP